MRCSGDCAGKAAHSPEQYEGETSEGPTRKYYRITRAGQKKREELLEEWRRLCDALAALGVE